MIFNTYYLFISTIVAISLMISIYLHFIVKKTNLALLLLLITAFIVRLFIASIDPFLQDWDERFHALVAKNMMSNPFKPMMRLDPILPYKIEDWCCNHIWVHKQPLFLWQMALSMKIFGTNEIALRLPSVVMGTISIYFVYDIAKMWLKNLDVAFFAASLCTFSYYQLELISGRFSLEHNDLAFAFYVTASVWGFLKYNYTQDKLKWSILIGVFVGCAILNKWLTGLLVYGGWGLYLLLSKTERLKWKKWADLGLSLLVSLIVFLPWQLYINAQFPLETAVMHEHNNLHIFEDLGHSGSIWFHIDQMRSTYGQYLLIFLIPGLYWVLKNSEINKQITIAFFAMIIAIYSFFSIIVQTKMPAFTYPVNSLVWILISLGIVSSFSIIVPKFRNTSILIVLIMVCIYTLKPWQILAHRSVNNIERNNKIENTKIYKTIDFSGELKGRVIFNCKSFTDVELMFYQNVNAFHWYPPQSALDSLIEKGYKFAAFKDHNDQHLPEYIYSNKDVLIIDRSIK